MSCSYQKPFLTAVELSIGYKKKTVLDGISFDLRRGDIFAVVGHNGSGKSTLIKTILGILPPISGETLWATNNPADKGYLGQIADFDRRFPARVIDLAIMGGWSKLGFFGRANKNLKDRAYDALVKTGIDHIAERPIHELSSGQLQRALFARAIVQDAQCILLDEPFNAVDQEASRIDHSLGKSGARRHAGFARSYNCAQACQQGLTGWTWQSPIWSTTSFINTREACGTGVFIIKPGTVYAELIYRPL